MQWKQIKSAHNSSTSKIGSYCNHKASHKAQLLTIRLASSSTQQTGEPEKKKSMRCLVHWNIYSFGRSPPPELPVTHCQSTLFPASPLSQYASKEGRMRGRSCTSVVCPYRCPCPAALCPDPTRRRCRCVSLRGGDAGGPAREGAAALLDVARGRGAGSGEAGQRWAALEWRG